MNMKRWCTLGLSCLLTGAAVFPVAGQAKPLNITWIAGNAALQTEHRVREGFQSFLNEKGVKDWNITYLDSAGVAERVANNIQDAVSRGSEFILVTIADLRASSGALSVAAAANVPVFTADTGWIPGVITDVTTNNWQMSSEVSLELIGRIRGRGNLVFLTAEGLKPVRERADTLRAILREYPNVKVIAEYDVNISNFYQDTMNAVQDIATRFGDQIDAVWAPWDEPAQAAVTALTAAGLNRVPVSGMDGHQSALDVICSDSMFIATGRQQFELWGATLAEYIYRIGEQGESAEAVKTADIVYFPARLFTKADCKK